MAVQAIHLLSLIAKFCLCVCFSGDLSRVARASLASGPPQAVVVAYVRLTPEVDGAYFAAFVEHYRQLGFDKVVAIRMNENLPEVTDRLAERFGGFLDVVPARRERRVAVPENSAFTATAPAAVLGRGFDWVLVVDSDEYLVISPRYGSIQDFIAAKEAEHGRLDAFSFRWALSHGLAPRCSDVPLRDLLRASVAVRAVRVKTMSRIESLVLGKKPIIHLADKMKEGSRLFFEGRAFGFGSARARYNTFSAASYSDSVLFHLETRSLASLVSKALLPVGYNKRVHSMQVLKAMMHSNHTAPRGYATFVRALGQKANKPLESGGCMHLSMASASGAVRCNRQPERQVVDLSHFVPTASSSAASQRQQGTTTAAACDRAAEQRSLETLLRSHNIRASQMWETLREVALELKNKTATCCPTLAGLIFAGV